MNSYTKKRMIQSLNESLEKRYVQEKKEKLMSLNEGWWERAKAKAAGFASRFVTIGRNLGSSQDVNPKIEAAKARVRSRAQDLQNELIQFEEDLNLLFTKAQEDELADKAKKLQTNRKGENIGNIRGGVSMENQLNDLTAGIDAYLTAIAQLKTLNEGLLGISKSA
jgi:hypothetical protein